MTFFFHSWLLPTFIHYSGHGKPSGYDSFSLYCLVFGKLSPYKQWILPLWNVFSLIIAWHSFILFSPSGTSVTTILLLLLQSFLPLNFSLEFPTLRVLEECLIVTLLFISKIYFLVLDFYFTFQTKVIYDAFEPKKISFPTPKFFPLFYSNCVTRGYLIWILNILCPSFEPLNFSIYLAIFLLFLQSKNEFFQDEHPKCE